MGNISKKLRSINYYNVVEWKKARVKSWQLNTPGKAEVSRIWIMSSRSCLIINPCSEDNTEKQKFQPSNLEQADSSLVSLGVTQISNFDKDKHAQDYRICKTDQNEGILADLYTNAAHLEQTFCSTKSMWYQNQWDYILWQILSLVILHVKKKSKSSVAKKVDQSKHMHKWHTFKSCSYHWTQYFCSQSEYPHRSYFLQFTIIPWLSKENSQGKIQQALVQTFQTM